MMPDINEMLPFLIPLAIMEVVLLIYTLHHILTHQTYRHGSRALWIVITLIGMQFIGMVAHNHPQRDLIPSSGVSETATV